MLEITNTMIIYYLIIINIITFIIFGVDKNIAKNGGQRISELRLHFLELIGGIFSIVIGIHIFRHKRSKISYFLITYIILIFWVYGIWKYFY